MGKGQKGRIDNKDEEIRDENAVNIGLEEERGCI